MTLGTTLKFSPAAQANIDETGASPLEDAQLLALGQVTRESLLNHCLDGADEGRHQGWREYVDTICAAVEGLGVPGRAVIALDRINRATDKLWTALTEAGVTDAVVLNAARDCLREVAAGQRMARPLYKLESR